MREPKADSKKIANRFRAQIHLNNLPFPDVTAKTNSWWTRAEYKRIQDGIVQYRLAKETIQQSKFFKPSGHRLMPDEKSCISTKFKPHASSESEKNSIVHEMTKSRPSSRLSDISSSLFMHPDDFIPPSRCNSPLRMYRMENREVAVQETNSPDWRN